MWTLTGSGSVLRSYAAFQQAQPADHGFDAGAHLLVLLQQRGAFAREVVLAMAQRAIFFGELLHQ